MKKIYIILPKVLNGHPRIKMPCGMMAAQVSHITAQATRTLKLKPDHAVVILQVADTKALNQMIAMLARVGHKFEVYQETNKLFKGKRTTAVITKPSDKLTVCCELWNCNCQ